MKGTVQYDGNVSDLFEICCVKQSCLLASTFFNIFFSLPIIRLSHWGRGYISAYTNRRQIVKPLFPENQNEIKNYSDKRCAVCKRCRSSCVQPITPSINFQFLDRFVNECIDFGFAISLKNTNFLTQWTTSPQPPPVTTFKSG